MEIKANPALETKDASGQNEEPTAPPSNQVFEANVFEPGVFE